MLADQPTAEVQRHLMGAPPTTQQAFRRVRASLGGLGADVLEVSKARYIVYRRGQRNFVSLTLQQNGLLIWLGSAHLWEAVPGVHRNLKDATYRIEAPGEPDSLDRAERFMRRAYEMAA